MSASSDVRQGEVETYLKRLGMGPETSTSPNLGPLARLQCAHVTTIPFETLAVTGDPYGEKFGLQYGPG